jgi:hypothetical protein
MAVYWEIKLRSQSLLAVCLFSQSLRAKLRRRVPAMVGLPRRQPTSRDMRPRYACGFTYNGQYYNETLSGGKVLDFKRGPPFPGNTDPSETIATANGTFTITPGAGSNPDTITYTYGASSFKYSITPKSTTAPGIYTFCQEAGPNAAQTLSVTVQVGPARSTLRRNQAVDLDSPIASSAGLRGAADPMRVRCSPSPFRLVPPQFSPDWTCSCGETWSRLSWRVAGDLDSCPQRSWQPRRPSTQFKPSPRGVCKGLAESPSVEHSREG